MASKGSTRHIKSLATSKFAAIERKAHGKYMMKPAAGRHTLGKSLPLSIILTKGAAADRMGDAKKSIHAGHVMVNGNVVRSVKYPVGLNDVVEIVPSGKYLHIGINERGQMAMTDTKKGEVSKRVCKVIGKYKSEKNQVMIRLHDGTNLKLKGDVKVNDSIMLDSKNEIEKVLPLKKGSSCLVIEGVHVGTKGKITELKEGNMHKSASAVIVSGENSNFETLVKNLMVIS
jgi:small subunit ribosomal protein S4e